MENIGHGKYRQKFSITFLVQKFGKIYCSMLARIFVFTGEDVSNAFKKKEIGSSKKIESTTPSRCFAVQNKILNWVGKFFNIQNIVLQKTRRWVEVSYQLCKIWNHILA